MVGGFEKSVPISWSQRHSSVFPSNSLQRQSGHQPCVPASRTLKFYEFQAYMEGREFCFLSFEGPYKPTGRQLDREGFTEIFHFLIFLNFMGARTSYHRGNS